MDFLFNVNELFKDEITIVDSGGLELCRRKGPREDFYQLQSKLYEIIDRMGEASAKAQGLNGSITTSRRLKVSDHKLYVMSDHDGNSGKGCVVGMLKVGRKKLFVYDHTKMQHEVQPLCILDFYVHESRQRMGCGRKLFDFMLGREAIQVQHVAIDKPSPKLLSFMAKHYGLQVVIPQVNNFVIFEGFPFTRSDVSNNIDGRTWSTQTTGSGWRHHNTGAFNIAKNSSTTWPMTNTLGQEGHMGAGDMRYSRHAVTGSGSHKDRNPALRNSQLDHPQSANRYTSYSTTSGNTSTQYHNQMNTSLPQSQVAPSHHTDMFNVHRKYLQTNGHLAVPVGSTSTSISDRRSQPSSQTMFNDTAVRCQSSGTSWTVMGVLRDQQLNSLMSPGHTSNHRLW